MRLCFTLPGYGAKAAVISIVSDYNYVFLQAARSRQAAVAQTPPQTAAKRPVTTPVSVTASLKPALEPSPPKSTARPHAAAWKNWETNASAVAWQAERELAGALCIAFSPRSKRGLGLVAVGTRAGAVWLFRLAPGSNGQVACLDIPRLVSCADDCGGGYCNRAWVTNVAFADTDGRSCLLAGLSDGRVVSRDVDADPALPSIDDRNVWAPQRTLIGADGRTVTCLRPDSDGGLLAVGKADGSVSVVSLAGPSSAPKETCQQLKSPSFFPVTGLAWSCDQAAGAGGTASSRLLHASTLEGGLQSWEVDASAGITVRAREGEPQSVSRPSRVSRHSWGAYGLAVSGNGLLLCTLRAARHPSVEATVYAVWGLGNGLGDVYVCAAFSERFLTIWVFIFDVQPRV